MSSRLASQIIAVSLILTLSHAAGAEVLVWWAPAGNHSAGAPNTTLEILTPAVPGPVDIFVDMLAVSTQGEGIQAHHTDLFGDFLDNGTTTGQGWFVQFPGVVEPGFVLRGIGELAVFPFDDGLPAGQIGLFLRGRFIVNRLGVPGEVHELFQGVGEFGWVWNPPPNSGLRLGPNAPAGWIGPTGALPLPVVRVVEIPEPTGLTALSACIIVLVRRASQFHRSGCHV